MGVQLLWKYCGSQEFYLTLKLSFSEKFQTHMLWISGKMEKIMVVVQVIFFLLTYQQASFLKYECTFLSRILFEQKSKEKKVDNG